MQFKINDLLTGELIRLRYVKRFSTCRVQYPETVAEHSYFTALYCMVIADWVVERGGRKVDRGDLLRRALIHDMEEVRTGDLIRPFKHSSPEFTEQIAKASRHCFLEMLEEIFDASYVTEMVLLWETSKDDSIEGRILAFADFLSVLGYVLEEIRGSNRTMREHVLMLRDYCAKFDTEPFEFIRPLVLEAKKLVHGEVLA